MDRSGEGGLMCFHCLFLLIVTNKIQHCRNYRVSLATAVPRRDQAHQGLIAKSQIETEHLTFAR